MCLRISREILVFGNTMPQGTTQNRQIIGQIWSLGEGQGHMDLSMVDLDPFSKIRELDQVCVTEPKICTLKESHVCYGTHSYYLSSLNILFIF